MKDRVWKAPKEENKDPKKKEKKAPKPRTDSWGYYIEGGCNDPEAVWQRKINGEGII